MTTSLVILAAGRARRYGGIKPLAPIGPHDEPVIDLLVGDAVRAGFTSIVLVINPTTGPMIQEHVKSAWPDYIDVRFALQAEPHGTVHAVLAARDHVDPTRPFGVANADDLYGVDALQILARHLGASNSNALVGFELANAIVGTDPVTRGVCDVEGDRLTSIAERRRVAFTNGHYLADDDVEPAHLDPTSLVSMNLWGFAADMWGLFDDVMASVASSADAEVLLPDVIGQLIKGEIGAANASLSEITVLTTDARCVGVTHPGDLLVVKADIAKQIAQGERPLTPFGS